MNNVDIKTRGLFPDNPQRQKAVDDLAAMAGHAHSLPNHTGGRTRIRLNTAATPPRLEAYVGGKWVSIGG